MAKKKLAHLGGTGLFFLLQECVAALPVVSEVRHERL